MKKTRTVLLSSFILCLCFGLIVAVLGISDNTVWAESEFGTVINPQIVEGETVFQIETKSDWQPNTPADFKVELDEYAEFDAEYLALSIAVKNLASDWFVFRFGVNDSYFCYGEVSNANQYTAVTSAGNSFSVLQQYGYWFFVPNGFDGVIYIPVSQCYVDGSLVSQAKNIYIQYDDSLASQSTVAFRSVYCVDQIGLEGTQKYPVFDFINLSADIEGNVSNDTDGRYTGRNLQASIVRDKYRSCDGVELHNDFINSLNITVKTASAGGTVVAQPYEFGWVAVDLGENAFTLADGIALNIFGGSAECYFKVFIEDEYGGIYKPSILSFDFFNAETYPFVYSGIPYGLKACFGCFYLTKDEIGTLYIPKTSFVKLGDGSEFMGVMPEYGREMGKIETIYIGLDMAQNAALGRSLSVGAFGNVDLEAGTVQEIIDLCALSNDQLNIADVDAGTVVYACSTDEHNANFMFGRVETNALPTYIEKDTLLALIESCNTLNKDDFDPDAWMELESKLIVAQSVYDNPFASQLQIDTAKKELSAIKFQLLGSTVDREKGCGALFDSVNDCVAIFCTVMVIAILSWKRRERL